MYIIAQQYNTTILRCLRNIFSLTTCYFSAGYFTTCRAKATKLGERERREIVTGIHVRVADMLLHIQSFSVHSIYYVGYTCNSITHHSLQPSPAGTESPISSCCPLYSHSTTKDMKHSIRPHMYNWHM